MVMAKYKLNLKKEKQEPKSQKIINFKKTL